MKAVAAFETSGATGSAALLLDGRVSEVELARGRAHASDLLPALDGLLRAAGLQLAELDALVVGRGPGSFTGLRVAAATALGLARGAGLALLGVPSFEASACDALAPGEEGAVVADARSGALYYARYRRLPETVETLTPPQALAPHELLERIAGARVLVGDAALPKSLLLPDGGRWRAAPPRASTLARLGAARLLLHGPSPPEEIEPLYLRPFAVRGRP